MCSHSFNFPKQIKTFGLVCLSNGEENKIRKSMPSSNKRKMGRDRISALPDRLTHRIFAFLDMKQVVQTSVLSTRWRRLWVSNPYLNIQYDTWEGYQPSEDYSCDQFKIFVDRVLYLRDGSNIHKLYLQCGSESEPEQFGMWVTSVIRKNVQEVKLESMEISHSTLKSLAAQVKSLTLESVVFQKEDDGHDELLLSSTIMENLIIDKCDYNKHQRLIVNAPNLKYLMLNADSDRDYCYPYYGDDDSWGIKICAQNLEVLRMKGCLTHDYSLENLSALVTAEIILYCVPAEERVARCLSNILKGLVNTKSSLTLSASCFQVFPEAPNTLNTIPVFPNVTYLKLTEWCTTGYICVIAKLLEKFPCVETLIMEGTEVELEETNGGDWNAQLLSPCMLCHLKSIEIQNPQVCGNEVKFLEFLMENAKGLENIVLTTTNTQSTEKEKLVKFREKVQEIPKASSMVRVLLEERNTSDVW